ncbi:MAG: cyclic nucleotide-binding domain-containing protein, partial [Gammaproteobacteria bacterium]|nr:cyclic nucleotide-binding domain-containing protein [Gammaproteobacteria bacterium]
RDGYLDAEQVMDVLNEVDRVRPSFGDVLVSLGMLTSAAMETELNRHLMAVSQYEKIQEALRQVEFFRHLDKGSLRSLANIAEKLTLGAQRQVVTEGEPADSFYAVVDGYLRITKENPKEGAEPVYIGNIGANDVFGEASIFEEAYRTANVITETETVLLRFRRKPFLLFLKNHPAGSQSILVFIIQRLLK